MVSKMPRERFRIPNFTCLLQKSTSILQDGSPFADDSTVPNCEDWKFGSYLAKLFFSHSCSSFSGWNS